MQYSELCEVYEKLEGTSKRLEKTEILSEFLKKLKKEKNKEIIHLLRGSVFPSWSEKETGVSSQIVIKAISKASGISSAETTNLWKKIGDLGRVAEQLAKEKKQKTLAQTKLTTEKVIDNIRKISELEGKGTVEKKLSLIAELLSSAEPLEVRYIIRTLLGELRIGVADGTLRDAIVWACFDKADKEAYIAVQESYDKATDFAVVFENACRGMKNLQDIGMEPGKPIKVMLALKVKDIAEAFETVGKPAACFPEGELIASNPLAKPIEQLKENDLVIGKSGKFQKITKRFERAYTGDIIKITPNYLFPFRVTPEHRILAIKKQLCSWKNRKISCRPNCQEQKYRCKKNYKGYKIEWIKSAKLEKGDFLLFPKFNEIKEINKIDLLYYNKDKKDIEVKNGYIRNCSKLKGTFKTKWVSRFVYLSPEFFELMGWYLAEGDFDMRGRAIRFSLGYKENEESKRISELIKEVFSLNSKISKRNSVINVRVFSTLLINFFKENFNNYSTNKKIPSFIMNASPDKIKHFIRAYIKGDGCKRGDSYIISTASRNIAYQMILLLSKIGILPCMGKYKNRGLGSIIYNTVIFGKQIDNIEEKTHTKKTHHQRFFEDNNFFYVPIREIETSSYRGKVFNLETEDNTYLSSAVVHNCEMKYDGFRLMLNKDSEGRIKLFTRRLDNVTKQFPEVVDYVNKYVKGKSFILDSEAVGYDAKNKRYMPFQAISQRIKRKYDIEKLQKELPVEVNVFDILYYEGKNLIKEPFKERRKLLEKIVKNEKWKFKLAEQIITESEKEAEQFYKKALAVGEEGIMFKALGAPYKPGARVGYMIKLKPEERDFDLVIVGGEYGTGKRSGWLSSFILACRDKNKFLEVGKVGTGIKEKEQEEIEESERGVSFSQLTKMLKPLITEEKGREVKVKPKIVVSVTFQEIQKSPTYSSGYALRFPRLTALRPDRSPGDITTLREIEKEHSAQRRKSGK